MTTRTRRGRPDRPQLRALRQSPRPRPHRVRGPNRAMGTKRAREIRAAWIRISVAAIVVVGALFGVYAFGGRGSAPGHMDGSGRVAAGEPGQGAMAPPLALPSAQGGTFDLASMRGSTVMLFFQEGLMCPPCWDQLAEIEGSWDSFEAMGIDAIASITHDPIDSLRELARTSGFGTPLLSDSDLAVSLTYDTPTYGMHPGHTNGHSFVVVGPDGTIRWRADYGGPPDYSMYVPMGQLIEDVRRGLGA
jgi:peroxiredoxin